MFDPWYKSTFSYSALGANLKIKIPHDVFSTQRIDEGTLLLLDHLPKTEPKTILDMGCGYGALGLPIAAKYKDAQLDLVDRDLLAVDASKKNALENQLSNVDAYGSLGFRDLKKKTYDWVLCNVPARIGTPFIRQFIERGTSLLSDAGELRIVVINDLTPVLKELQNQLHWQLNEIAVGPKHSIFSMKKYTPHLALLDDHELYFRDQVNVLDLELDRPFDLGGDDQKRIRTSLPILIDTLPRTALRATQKVLCFRGYYGTLALVSRKRWPDAQIISVERDLLSSTFALFNADRLNLSDPNKLEIREAAHFPDAIRTNEKFDLTIGEISPSASEDVALSELHTAYQTLTQGGQALILCLEKTEKDWVQKFSQKEKVAIQRVLTRESFTVVRMSK